MAVSKFKVTYIGDQEPEEITAAGYTQNGDWFIFADGLGDVTRIRSVNVERIDRL